MAAWIDRPTFPYKGASAEERQYRITNATMLRGPKTKIVWNRIDQMMAYRRGFFVSREEKTERVVLQPFGICPSLRNPRYTLCVRDTSPETNKQLLAVIAREAFRLDPFFSRLADFIRQQDTYGWFGAWGGRSDKVESKSAASWLRWHAEQTARAKQNHRSSMPSKLWTDL